MPEKPRVSVVIPTRNRQDLLHRLLDSLAQMEIKPGEMEVVVVDDGSTDGTPGSLARRRDPFPLRLVQNQEPAGPSAARNQGSLAAAGEILGFLDSDVTALPEWWKHAEPHFRNPRVAAVEGATLPPAGSLQPTPFTHFVFNNRGESFQTCNFLVRREVFLRVGMFDERYCWKDRRGKIWHVREDTDLAFMILSEGLKIVFEPKAIAIHPLFPASRGIYLDKTYYGSQEVLLRRKHPRLYREKLGWLNGRAFPVFYWGVFLGWPLAIVSLLAHAPLAALSGLALAGMGWAGSVYAVCRKRKVTPADLMTLVPQFFVIPWMRLFWVLAGEWKFRKVKAWHRSDGSAGSAGPQDLEEPL